MRWAEGFIAADWGTTNRRAYRIGAGGTLQPEVGGGGGVRAVPARGGGHHPACLPDRRRRHASARDGGREGHSLRPGWGLPRRGRGAAGAARRCAAVARGGGRVAPRR